MLGHAWTLWPFVRDAARPPRPPPSRPWSLTVTDPDVGAVRLTGHLRDEPGADAICVLVHGLAGCADASYCLRAAEIAAGLGISTLRVNLRGADRSGDDFYHGGLSGDLAAALASPEVARYRQVHVLGFSLGGHLALKLAAEEPGLVTSVAAVCAPVDLGAACKHIDGPAGLVYRPYLLRGLRAVYQAVAARRPVPSPVAEIRRVRSIRRWDELTVVRRFGFQSAEDYYQRASVWPKLPELAARSLLVVAESDPMVAAHTLRPRLLAASPKLEVRWHKRAGHVGFPLSAKVERDILDWMLRAT